MGQQFNDYGALGFDRTAQPYAEPPRFTVLPNDAIVGTLVYEAQRHADTARIHAERLTRTADSILSHDIADAQLQGVKDAAAACERAIADVIAKLTRAA